jgi:hypothetical protein
MLNDQFEEWELEGLKLGYFGPGGRGSWEEPAYPPEAEWTFEGISTHVSCLDAGEGERILPRPGDYIKFRRTIYEGDETFWDVDFVGEIKGIPRLLEDGTIEVEAEGEGYWTGICPVQSLRGRKL